MKPPITSFLLVPPSFFAAFVAACRVGFLDPVAVGIATVAVCVVAWFMVGRYE